MLFRICDVNERILYRRDIVCLYRDNWDDYNFKTSFDAIYYDSMGRRFVLGSVKIGMRGMEYGNIHELLPKEFEYILDSCFSLGQDESYYESIAHLGERTRKSILLALRDVAFDLSLFEEICDEKVAQCSLLRGIKGNVVKEQWNRMARGGARLTEYNFTYTAPTEDNSSNRPIELTFSVRPRTSPPTNVHALIGRNGCGKTYLIRKMVQCLQNRKGPFGRFRYSDQTNETSEFTNVLCIAFSPFDDFAKLIDTNGLLPATFVGLDKDKGDLLVSVKAQFLEHFEHCLMSERKQSLWKAAIGILSSDPTFEQEGILSFADDAAIYSGYRMSESMTHRISEAFDRLSSGHKVVLLIITSCVAEVEERSIVFLDEPENHLHPPLLAALIRALSNLLEDRNGVAIVSTHSPVVLQEVPRSCVWMIDRYRKPHRPRQETFGTTIGSLTDEVFKLEVSKSGFHKMLFEKVRQHDDYETILSTFGGQLGDEARMLLWTLLSLKEEGELE